MKINMVIHIIQIIKLHLQTITEKNDGLFIMVIGGLGMIIPTQGGIGSYHLAVKIGLIGLGVSASPALLFAFTVHTAQTLMTLIFGSISLLLLFISKKKS